MTAAAEQLRLGIGAAPPPPAKRRRPAARIDPVDAARDRAADLALAVAAVVAKLQAGRSVRAELVQRAVEDLAALEVLCGVADVALPPHGGERGSAERRAWIGWAPPQDDAQEAAALACWAALGEPLEAWVLTWRAALAGGELVPRGPRPRRSHEPRRPEGRSETLGHPPSTSMYGFGR